MAGFEQLNTESAALHATEAANPLFDTAYSAGRVSKMVGLGVAGAIGDTACHPLDKLPELGISLGTGAALGVLNRMTGSRSIVSLGIGAAMLGKLAYDEYTGNRWSTFGKAAADAWHSGKNMNSDIAATQKSLGSFVVDMGVGYGGMKIGGLAVSRYAAPGKTMEYAINRADFDHGQTLRQLQDRWEDPADIQTQTEGKLELIARSQPAVPGEARGDLIRVAKTPDGKILLSAMDVYGHGTAAAKVAARLQAQIDDILPETAGKTASDILGMIDQRLENKSDNGATAALSLYDPLTNELQTATASSELAFVVRADGTVQQLDKEVGGMLLGQHMYADFPRGNDVTHLQPGDTVIMASDGSFERFMWGNASGFESFLKETGAKPEEIQRGILKAPAPATGIDDTSFIIFRRAA